MKNDLIQTYEGSLILPFGTPYIISTAWESKTQYHTQSMCFLDCLDNTVDLSFHYQTFAKTAPEGHPPGSLSKAGAMEYVLEYGYNMAFMNIPTALWNYAYRRLNTKKNLPNPSKLEIELKPTKDRNLVVLTHLLRKDKKAFAWVEEQAKADILNALLKTAKSLNIQSSQTYHGK